jgi:hypothetical protein
MINQKSFGGLFRRRIFVLVEAGRDVDDCFWIRLYYFLTAYLTVGWRATGFASFELDFTEPNDTDRASGTRNSSD